MKTPKPFFIIKGQQVSRTKSQENLKLFLVVHTSSISNNTTAIPSSRDNT